MELLQKITLYDLLGYTLPGTVLLWLFQWDGTLYQLKEMEEIKLGYCILLLILGYLAGIIISEIAEWIIPKKIKKDEYWKKICNIYGISKDKLENALRNAKVISGVIQETELKLLQKYESYIFSDIQVDSKYSRIHNYASAELLYKNMIVVSIIVIITGSIQQLELKIWIGLLGTFAFATRWNRFMERRLGYTICWFLKKYEQ